MLDLLLHRWSSGLVRGHLPHLLPTSNPKDPSKFVRILLSDCKSFREQLKGKEHSSKNSTHMTSLNSIYRIRKNRVIISSLCCICLIFTDTQTEIQRSCIISFNIHNYLNTNWIPKAHFAFHHSTCICSINTSWGPCINQALVGCHTEERRAWFLRSFVSLWGPPLEVTWLGLLCCAVAFSWLSFFIWIQIGT